MKINAQSVDIDFHFKNPAKTSRNTLTHKISHFIVLKDEAGFKGIGECSPVYGLSVENRDDLKIKIEDCLQLINSGISPVDIDTEGFPSLTFALETSILDLKSKGSKILFKTNFTQNEAPIRINGLIWMGDLEFMDYQVKDKIEKGFNCIKIKIGSHDFESEIVFLEKLRKNYGSKIELRLDANGAFEADSALEKLRVLSKFDIHSIEQPIKVGQTEIMAELVKNSPIPIALDEELIGIQIQNIPELLDLIKPQYIILKPGLLGGFKICDAWVLEAEKRRIGWWATSFLESNIGLNAIAQWTSQYNTEMYQGLGTGNIYAYNIESPLELKGEKLYYSTSKKWQLSEIL